MSVTLKAMLQSHVEQDDERHAELQTALTQMAQSVGAFGKTMEGFTTKVDGLMTYRAQQDARDQTVRRIFYAFIAIAGIAVPIIVLVIDKLWK